MAYDEERVRRGLAALDALERGKRYGGSLVKLDRRVTPSAGDRVLVFRGGKPSVDEYPIGDESRPGTWLVGVMRIGGASVVDAP
jgi:hypothetical protein